MDLDVVLPVYNEADNLVPLIVEVNEALEGICPHRIILVDDGSQDSSWNVIVEQSRQYEHVAGLRFSHNQGQSAAFKAGFEATTASLVVTMDADGQNDPADIPMLIEELEDVDVVAGYRANRQDSIWKKLGSKIGNSVRNWMTGDDIIDTGCSLKLFRRDVVKDIPMFVGMHRFLPTLARMKGYGVKQVPVNHRSRWEGETSYTNLGRLKTTIADLLAVRWMQSRVINYDVEETLKMSDENVS